MKPPLEPEPLKVGLSGSPDVEGLGMASALLEPSVLMLTGGFGRSGRETAVRVLVKGQAGWNWASVDTSADWGKEHVCYHSREDLSCMINEISTSVPLNQYSPVFQLLN